MKKSFLNKIILVVVLTLSVAATWLYANPVDVATDSGFDTSYDGGSGGYSGGGSSWSSSGDSSGSSNNNLEEWKKLSTPEKLLTLMPLWLFIIISIWIYVWIYRDSPRSLSLNKNKAITEEEFSKYIKDETMEQFILNRYQDYLAIQYAWMEFKYDMLSNKTTNELYNQYQMQLETLKTKGQKNVMKEFLYVDGMITSVSKVNNQTTVTVEIVTKFYDYIINEKNQVIIRGNDSKKVSMHYRMVFIKNNSLKLKTHCPKCGAELKNTSTNVCEFCRTKITKETEEWLLAEKECISQQ